MNLLLTGEVWCFEFCCRLVVQTHTEIHYQQQEALNTASHSVEEKQCMQDLVLYCKSLKLHVVYSHFFCLRHCITIHNKNVL